MNKTFIIWSVAVFAVIMSIPLYFVRPVIYDVRETTLVGKIVSDRGAYAPDNTALTFGIDGTTFRNNTMCKFNIENTDLLDVPFVKVKALVKYKTDGMELVDGQEKLFNNELINICAYSLIKPTLDQYIIDGAKHVQTN